MADFDRAACVDFEIALAAHLGAAGAIPGTLVRVSALHAGSVVVAYTLRPRPGTSAEQCAAGAERALQPADLADFEAALSARLRRQLRASVLSAPTVRLDAAADAVDLARMRVEAARQREVVAAQESEIAAARERESEVRLPPQPAAPLTNHKQTSTRQVCRPALL